MRKNSFFICPFILFYLGIFGQVGINTSGPQQTLQVSGSGTGINQPVLRVDGLNSTNNSAHESTTSIKRVYSTPNGDLVILDNNKTNRFYRVAPLPTTSVPGGTERLVTSVSFTLDYPSIVHVESRVGMGVTSSIIGTALLRDGMARLFGVYYKFTLAPAGVTLNTAFGQHIISHSTNSGINQLDGEFYLNPRKDLSLPAGNYTLSLYGFSQDANMSFAVNDVNQAGQTLSVSVTPISY
ncbi:hypothetical protein ACQWU4_02115 [Chryseobacterium sp. MIQD13]|uniref:hypothetical protein n=1 Tax=Chryseobacterium sp. MIQD13 TaxID=3422310 RepID=UPI003D276D13